MSHFLTPLITRHQDGREWVLYSPLSYRSDLIGPITVPKGFKTDLASIPRGVWNLVPKQGRYDPAAVVHDYLYVKQIHNRKVSDAVFLEAQEALGVSWLTRRTTYRAVRLFGWVGWQRRKQKKGKLS